jgi:hypothetical protein
MKKPQIAGAFFMCREEGVTRCARGPRGGVNPMPAPSSHGSFSVSLACSLREQIR